VFHVDLLCPQQFLEFPASVPRPVISSFLSFVFQVFSENISLPSNPVGLKVEAEGSSSAEEGKNGEFSKTVFVPMDGKTGVESVVAD